MVAKLASLVLTTATCLACGGPNAEPASLSSASEASASTCRPAPEQTAAIASNAGIPQWLQSYGSEVSSIATDSQGNVILTRSGEETLELNAEGAKLWSRPFGSLVATSPDDSVYIAGTFEATFDVEATSLSSAGARDVYVLKLDAGGALAYAIALGGSEDDALSSLAVDALGNAVVSGPGLGTVRLDGAGKLAWQKAYFGQVALDDAGNLLLAGALVGTQDFGGGPLSSQGGSDIVVVKLGPQGQHVFSRAFGDAGEQQGQGIAVDAQGAALVTGVFDGTVDFGSGVLELKPGSCPAEAWCKSSGFATKLDAEGSSLWSVELGPMRAMAGVASDSHGNFVLSGALPGGVAPYRSSLLAALDANGDQLWRRAEWPGTGIGSGHGVAIDACDDVIWSVSARPDLNTDERSYVAKLSP